MDIMDGWVGGQLFGWIDGNIKWMGGWVVNWLGGQLVGWIDGYNGWMDGWSVGWVDRWM